jgi:DNA-binding MarR family transcriptional regulator
MKQTKNNAHKIRLKILSALYTEHIENTQPASDCEDLSKSLAIPVSIIHRDVKYLKDKGYIEFKDREKGGILYRSLHITAEGIDLAEDRVDNDKPRSNFQVSVGKGARNVVIGKDILQEVKEVDSTSRLNILLNELNSIIEVADITAHVRDELTQQIRELVDLLKQNELI